VETIKSLANLFIISDHIAMLGALQPNLNRLELTPDLRESRIPSSSNHGTVTNLAPGADCLRAFQANWYFSLVRLDLKKMGDLEGIFAQMTTVNWPNLKTLVVVAGWDGKFVDVEMLRAVNQETCTFLVQELATMLGKARNIATVLIESHDYSWTLGPSSFRFQFCLGYPDPDVNPTYGDPCSFGALSYKFVPTHVRIYLSPAKPWDLAEQSNQAR
jgi:hypothetical protein